MDAALGIGAELDAIEVLANSYQAGRAGLLARRVAQGRSCDGHGDLQAADVYLLDDGPRVLDCLGFDPVLRAGDVLADVAFLAMDLERLGAAGAAAALLRAYRSLTGEDWPASLADFWVAYRALVRAKVALLRAPWDPDAPGQAEVLLGLCRRHLEAATVRLVLVGGAPGTGKTTVASRIADRTGWVPLATDEVRADLPSSAAPAEANGAGYGVGRYRAGLVSATYRLLLERAESCLAAGESVVLDATWTSAGHRAAAALRGQAQTGGAAVVDVEQRDEGGWVVVHPSGTWTGSARWRSSRSSPTWPGRPWSWTWPRCPSSTPQASARWSPGCGPCGAPGATWRWSAHDPPCGVCST